MTEKKPLNVACIGGGMDSAVGRTHYIAMTMENNFKIVCGCFSLNKKKNIESAMEYGIPLDRVYNRLEDIIDNEKNNIDAIIILTPTNLHYDHLTTCLNANIPIICEKALVASTEEAYLIKELCQKQNRFLLVTYNYLGYPMLRELREMILKGVLGKICHLNVDMPQEGFIKINTTTTTPNTPQAWRLSDSHIPTVSLDLGVHLHSIIRYLTEKKPIEVVSSCQNYGHFNTITDFVSALIHYSKNTTCSMTYGKSFLGHRNGLKVEIFGKKGSALWIQETPEIIKLTNQNGDISILDRGSQNLLVANKKRYERFKAGHPSGFIEAFANFYVDARKLLLNYIATKKLPKNIYDVDSSLEGLSLLSAISESSKQKKWISLSKNNTSL